MEKISGLELIPIKCQLMLSYAQASKSEREMRVGFSIQANDASSLCTLGLKWIFAQYMKKKIFDSCGQRLQQQEIAEACKWKIPKSCTKSVKDV